MEKTSHEIKYDVSYIPKEKGQLNVKKLNWLEKLF